MTFDVRVEDSAGVASGAGPIKTASRLSRTDRLDRGGTTSFDMPAVDAAAALFPDDEATYIRGRAYRDGTRVTVGRGIVKNKSINSDNRTLRLSGPGLEDELTRTTVGTLTLEATAGSETPLAAASILAAVMAGSVAGWSTSGTPSKEVYYRFGDETHLAALIKIAEITGDHFRFEDRTVVWLPTTSSGFDAVDSGIRAIDSGDADRLMDNDDVCLIDGGLEVVTDDTQRITRIYPRGGGNAEARLYINATTEFSAPVLTGSETGTATFPDNADPLLAVYALVKNYDRPDLSYIKHIANDAAAQIGAVESFRDIAPESDSDTATQSAANTLVNAALVALKRRIHAQKAYRLRMRKVVGTLKPGEALYVKSKHITDGYKWMDEGRYVLMLEVTQTYDAEGGLVWELQVTV